MPPTLSDKRPGRIVPGAGGRVKKRLNAGIFQPSERPPGRLSNFIVDLYWSELRIMCVESARFEFFICRLFVLIFHMVKCYVFVYWFMIDFEMNCVIFVDLGMIE